MIFTTNHSTSCDFCGQGIQNAYTVESADGKRFKVGCDCIRKTGDKGLTKVVTDEEARKRRAKADAKRKAKWQRERDLVAAFKSGQCESLRRLPHPKGREGSAHDYVSWCVEYHCVGEVALRLIEQSIL